MKQILIWNDTKNMYDIKVLSPSEKEQYDRLIELKEKAKNLYYDVIQDARNAGMPLGIFIDNEAYSTCLLQNNMVSECTKIADSLGLKFAIPQLLFD